jgi:hypothetical protein
MSTAGVFFADGQMKSLTRFSHELRTGRWPLRHAAPSFACVLSIRVTSCCVVSLQYEAAAHFFTGCGPAECCNWRRYWLYLVWKLYAELANGLHPAQNTCALPSMLGISLPCCTVSRLLLLKISSKSGCTARHCALCRPLLSIPA